MVISANLGVRNRKGSFGERQRANIKTGVLVKRLRDHAVGEIEMSSTQIQAARILLNKTLPDLKAIEQAISGGVTINVVDPIVRPDDTNG